jgi:molecular chaperone HscB
MFEQVVQTAAVIASFKGFLYVLYLYRMNYFELFEIPIQLKVDPAAIQQKFYALSRKYHPDFFSQAGEASQAESLEKTALLNKAWKTFQQPDETIKYVLQLKGLLQDEEKYELAPAFLMEVMDINEEMMDIEDNPGHFPGLEKRVNELQTSIYEPVQQIVEHYKESIVTEKELLQVKEYYFFKKYLRRILDKMPAMRNIAPRS